MKPFELSIPTKLYFGRGILKDSLYKLRDLMKGNIMIVTTGRSLLRLGYLSALEQSVRELPYVTKVVIYDGISANPRLQEVKDGIAVGKQEEIKVIIGFGGGSAIDAAKAIAAGIGTGEDMGVFFHQGKEPSEATLPIIAIPTTAGTGSELSKAAILTDTEQMVKNGIRGEALFPKAAIVDSYLTEQIPFSITMETGFDVLAHAIESYLSKAANPFTRMQSEAVIRIVGTYLPKLAENLADTEAREQMSYASMLMGINLGNASTCLPHRLQYPLGAHTDTSHGAGLAALFPAWVTYEYVYSPDGMNRVICLLLGKECKSKEEAVSIIKKLLFDLKLPDSLGKLGVTKEDTKVMASEVSGNLANDPAAVEENIVEKIYEAAL